MFKNVKYESIRRSIPLVEVAVRTGYDLGDLSNYVNGGKKMPPLLKEKLVAFFKIPELILFSTDEKLYFRFILKKLEAGSGKEKT